MSILPCASCGEEKELTRSIKIDGVKQPRYCKECTLISMREEEIPVLIVAWLTQLKRDGDKDSYNKVCDMVWENR